MQHHARKTLLSFVGDDARCAPWTVGEQDEKNLQHSSHWETEPKGQRAGMPARFCE
jgi:hypothetical protein